MEIALSKYPAIRAAQAQRRAAEAGVELARTNYLPRAEMMWQQNRATRNNVFGLLLPQSVIPAISGPQLDSASVASAWGSAGGLLLSWEPFDFGLRKANVELARAIGRQATANEAVTRLDVSAAAADALLTLLAAEQTVEAAQAGVERAETLARAVRALVENQLRPGVDASRAEAELAAARNQLIQAEQNVELARADLAETIGEAGAGITIDPGPLLELPPAPPPFGGNQRTVIVRVDPERLRSYSMSPEEVAKAVAAGNAILPAGNVRTGDLNRLAPMNGVVRDIRELADLPIRNGAGPNVYVRDVGVVENGSDILTGYGLVNGRRTVYIPVTKRAEASTLEVVNRVKSELALPMSRGEPLLRAVWDATRETITPRLLAMLASYFLSNTLVPVLSAWLLRHSHAKERKQS
ncbi:MAG: efflux RND transporter permease subunit [Blastocatellia bacterium]